MQCIQKATKLIKTEPSEADITDSIETYRMEKHQKMFTNNTSMIQKQLHQNSQISHHQNQKIILSPRIDYTYHQPSKHHSSSNYMPSNDHRSRSPTNNAYHHHHQQQQHQQPSNTSTPQIIITQTSGTPVRVIRDGRFYEESRRNSMSSPPPSQLASSSSLSPSALSTGHHTQTNLPSTSGHHAVKQERCLDQQQPQQQQATSTVTTNRKYIVSRPVNVISSRNKIDMFNSGLNGNHGVNSSDTFRTPVVSSSANSSVSSNTPMRPPPPPPPPKVKTVTNLTSCGNSVATSATSSGGNEEPSSSIPDLEFDGTTVLCRVCGDKASGFHYGVHSCEGCKGFFRRSIQQKIQYRPCTKNQQCSILRINRNRCQYCRLKKCIAVGMSRDAVRFGRVPKREKARILAAMQQSTQNRGQQRALATELDDQPRLLAAVLRAHMETCEFTKEKVTAMRQRARECPSYSMPTLLACPLNPAPELQSEQEFSQRFAHVIRGVIDFAGMIPGFQLLTQDDKFTLLKAGLFDALFVRLICMFDSSINSIICLNGQVMRRDAIQNGANARFLVDSTFNFAERMNSMNLTDTEIGLFCAIVLITPDRPGLRNIELIEKMYSRLKACLQSVIAQNRPDQPEFLTELLKTLPDLRTLSTLHTEKLVVFRTEHKELLRQQMWTIDDDQPSKSPGSSTWDNNTMEDVAKSPLGSVSSTESGDLEYSQSSLASSAPLLAATLSGTCPLRHRANSGSSAEDIDIVGTHAHLTQNGLTITPVARSHHSHSLLNSRYRKLDSPTDSGIESGNEKAESTKTASSGGSSSCSSPRSTVDDVLDEQHNHHHHSHHHAQNGNNSMATKRQIVEDMPVLKRVLQAPPLYDTNSLMDEAYKPHKKFRALRHRDFETAEADAHVHHTTSSTTPVMNGSSSSMTTSSTQQQSQLHMHLTRNSNNNNSNNNHNHSSLSSTHSVLAKSLMEEPRMTPEQMKRTDIIQNYIMRDQPVNGLLVCAASSPTSSTSSSSSLSSSSSSSASANLNCSSSSTTTVTLSSPPPPPPHSMRWQSHSVITTTLRNQSVSPINNNVLSSNYFQSPHSTSISSPRASPSSVQSPRLLELQVDIADSQQPLNLSKKSPTPPPMQHHHVHQHQQQQQQQQQSSLPKTTTIQRSYPVAADITVTTATTNSQNGATAPQVHKILLEA